jgi:hypothetical protein
MANPNENQQASFNEIDISQDRGQIENYLQEIVKYRKQKNYPKLVQ